MCKNWRSRLLKGKEVDYRQRKRGSSRDGRSKRNAPKKRGTPLSEITRIEPAVVNTRSPGERDLVDG
jgi:hypothetical protein